MSTDFMYFICCKIATGIKQASAKIYSQLQKVMLNRYYKAQYKSRDIRWYIGNNENVQ